MNSAARLVYSVSRYDRITPLLTQLHSMKVVEWNEFKLAILAYRCLHQTALLYLAEEINPPVICCRGPSASRLCFNIFACCPRHLLFDHRRCRRTSRRCYQYLGNSSDNLCHPRSGAYSAQVLLNKSLSGLLPHLFSHSW